MVTPRWLDWDLFPGSACEDFIYQLSGKGVSSGIWKGMHLGDTPPPRLGFKGDFSDDDCKFALPVPLLRCNLWY